MLGRLLLVLLILTGSIPVRICTCPSAIAHPTPPAVESFPEQAGAKPHCCCRSSPVISPNDLSVLAADAGHDHDSGIPHTPDCPAANPLPLGEPALASGDPVSAGTLEFARFDADVAYVPGPILSTSPAHFYERPRALPRYLELLTLRI